MWVSHPKHGRNKIKTELEKAYRLSQGLKVSLISPGHVAREFDKGDGWAREGAHFRGTGFCCLRPFFLFCRPFDSDLISLLIQKRYKVPQLLQMLLQDATPFSLPHWLSISLQPEGDITAYFSLQRALHSAVPKSFLSEEINSDW